MPRHWHEKTYRMVFQQVVNNGKPNKFQQLWILHFFIVVPEFTRDHIVMPAFKKCEERIRTL
jgi:hypothetical protein